MSLKRAFGSSRLKAYLLALLERARDGCVLTHVDSRLFTQINKTMKANQHTPAIGLNSGPASYHNPKLRQVLTSTSFCPECMTVRVILADLMLLLGMKLTFMSTAPPTLTARPENPPDPPS